MYFFDIYSLANQLKENTMPAQDETLYYVGVLLCGAIMGKPYLLTISIAMYYLYRINKQGDDKDFLKRSIPLIFTTSLYYLLAFFVLQIALLAPTFIIAGLYGETKADFFVVTTFLLYLGIYIGLFISYLSFMGKQMRTISQKPVILE
ncbi:MAG: hypothetical protein AB7F19_02900 [Candidatus Babeliales bacterium]